jgi:hypothetical protein
MVTKEALLARRAQLDQDLAAQDQVMLQAQAQVADGQQKIRNANNMIQALSGAKQDCEFWLAQFPPDAPAPAAENIEQPAKESLN